MKNNIAIRFATKEDVPLLLEFIKQLAEYGNAGKDMVATKEILEESLFGERPYAEVILCYLNGTPVGYALFTHNFSTLLGRPGLYLVDLYLIPQIRNQGIGRKMLAFLASIAKNRKCGRFEWSTLKSNEIAINLYQSTGAKEMNEWITYRMTEQEIFSLASENTYPLT